MARNVGGRVRGGRIRISRRITPGKSFQTQVLQRSKFSQNIVQQKRQAKRDAAMANKIIQDINAGRIKNISQIPMRLRSAINVTQDQLNRINSYLAAKRDADAWKAAFNLADMVLRSNDPRAIFAISFSTNPHAKEAYVMAKNNLKAYAVRKKAIQNIRSGKVDNVAIVGGRIMDLSTGKPITPAAATAKQFYTTLQKDLSVGEVLLKDRNYNITHIKSAALKIVVPFNKKGIETYNRKISRTDFTKLRSRDDPKGLGMTVGQTLTAFIAGEFHAPNKITPLQPKSFLQKIKNPKKFFTNLTANTMHEIDILALKNKKTFVDQAILMGAEFVIPVQEALLGITLLPSFVRTSLKDPASLKKVPSSVWNGLKQSGAEIVALGKISPTRAVARIGGEIFVIYVTGKVFKVVGKVATKLNPFLKRIKNGKILLRVAPVESFTVRGSTRLLKARVLKPSFKRPFASVADFLKGRKPGQFKKFTKDPGLILKIQTVKSGAKPLSQQALIAGREVTAVNAGRQQLTGWLRRRVIVRKPILHPSNFKKDYALMIVKDPKNGARMARILKKFDKGITLTTREFADINKWLQKNIAPNITLLERSMYFDPASGLRVSRLGLQTRRNASLRDILSGNFNWKETKPSIFIMEKSIVEKFPKSLAKIKAKILKGQKLTTAETNKLIRWQVKPSGKLKPIGSTIYQGGVELEVTLAPGEFIKRIKRIGKVIVEGQKVEIVTAKIWKPTFSIKKSLAKAKLGKLKLPELRKLERLLSKKLGRKIRIETPSIKASTIRRALRRSDPNIPVLRLRGGFIYVVAGSKIGISRTSRKGVAKRKAVTRKPKRLTAAKRKAAARRVAAKRRKEVPKRPTRRSPVRPKPRAKPKPRPRPRAKPKRKARPKPRARAVARARGKPKSTPKIKTSPRSKDRFDKRRLKRKVEVFFIKVRKKKKIVNLNQKPLTLNDAKDYLAYNLDHNTIRSGWFEPLAPTRDVVSLPKSMRGYFGRNRRKLRPFKIRAGKKKAIRRGYIEKRKYILDTRGEKKQLRAAKRRKSRRKPVKRRVVKRNMVKKRVVKRKPTRRRKPVRKKSSRRRKRR